MLCETIKQLRLEKGMTQSELAEQLHVVRQTVSKWESGSSVPDALMLQRLAEVLDTSPDGLLGCQTETPSPAAPASLPRSAKIWAAAAVFWAVFSLFSPDAKAATDFDVPYFQIALILYQIRIHCAAPLFAACAASALIQLLQHRGTRLLVPKPVRLPCRILAVVMFCIGLHLIIGFVMLQARLKYPIISYIYSHPYTLILWQTAAAILFQLSSKERSP